MCEYALITLNMNEYANKYLKKTNKQTKKQTNKQTNKPNVLNIPESLMCLMYSE